MERRILAVLDPLSILRKQEMSNRTTVPAGCTWQGDPDERNLRHVMDCPVCSQLWPLIAREMRVATGRALPSDKPGYLGENVGYNDK